MIPLNVEIIDFMARSAGINSGPALTLRDGVALVLLAALMLVLAEGGRARRLIHPADPSAVDEEPPTR